MYVYIERIYAIHKLIEFAERVIKSKGVVFRTARRSKETEKKKQDGITTEKYWREIEERVFLAIYWPFRACKSAAERIR